MIASIPKILHQVRVGTKKTPTYQEDKFFQTFMDFHHGWEVMVWDEDRIRSTFEDHYSILRIRPHILMADIIRMFAIAECGGLYLDLDVGCCRSIEPLLVEDKIYLVNIWADRDGYLRDHRLSPWLNNWMMACPQGNLLMMKMAIEGLRRAKQQSVPRTLRAASLVAGCHYMEQWVKEDPSSFFLVGHDYLVEAEGIQNIKPPDAPILVHLGEHTWKKEIFGQSRSGDDRDFHPL